MKTLAHAPPLPTQRKNDEGTTQSEDEHHNGVSDAGNSPQRSRSSSGSKLSVLSVADVPMPNLAPTIAVVSGRAAETQPRNTQPNEAKKKTKKALPRNKKTERTPTAAHPPAPLTIIGPSPNHEGNRKGRDTKRSRIITRDARLKPTTDSFKRFAARISDRFIARTSVRLLYRMWLKSPEAAAVAKCDAQTRRRVMFEFASKNTSWRDVNEPSTSGPCVMERKAFQFFNEHIVYALGLQFTSTERRDALFHSWSEVYGSFPWRESLDSIVELFTRRVMVNGKVWSMSREGARYDAEYCLPERKRHTNPDFWLPNKEGKDNERTVRYTALASATLPLQSTWWGEAEGSFSWYLKHVAKVDTQLSKRNREKMVDGYCDWCVEEELKEKGLFWKRLKASFRELSRLHTSTK